MAVSPELPILIAPPGALNARVAPHAVVYPSRPRRSRTPLKLDFTPNPWNIYVNGNAKAGQPASKRQLETDRSPRLELRLGVQWEALGQS